MKLGIMLFIIGVYGFILNKKNIIIMLVSIEIMLLSVTIMILLNSVVMDDTIGLIYGLIIITIAGAEAAIGLGILVSYYRIRGNIRI